MSDELRKALKELSPQQDVTNLWATAQAVNSNTGLMDAQPTDGSALILDVRLGLKQSLMIPKKDTMCLIGIIEGKTQSAFLIWCEELEEMRINGDQFGGLVDAVELKKQIDKNTAAIKKIIDLFQNWTPVPNDGGAALKSASVQLATLQLAELDNIQNKVVKHG